MPLRLFVLMILAAALAGCSDEKTPIPVGFIGGLTGSNSDNGKAGLRGARLAVERTNQSGGINGRLVELIAVDDGQNPEIAAQSTQSLIKKQVVAVVGPFTSSMAQVIVPLTGKAGIFQVSPTISSMSFYGKDDNLFRINRTTRDNAEDYAEVLMRRKIVKVSVAYDLDNLNFSESWLKQFEQAYTSLGGRILATIGHKAGSQAEHDLTVSAMLKHKPDGLIFISGALDVARFAQSARKLNSRLPLIAAEWAATEQLLEFGGKVVEGLLIIQNHNSADNSELFREFNDAYYRRYNVSPGYSSVAAYDAMMVVLTALKNQQKGEPLKASALRSNPYQGLQQIINFDANGDTRRQVYFTEIRDGRYVQIKDGPKPR